MYEYYMFYALTYSQNSTCNRANVGAVIVKDEEIISVGTNMNLPGMCNCDKEGHTLVGNHCINTIHAEQDALMYCLQKGVSTRGATMYVTHYPCLTCAKLIVASGIREVYYKYGYNIDDYAVKLFEANGVLVQEAKGSNI